MPSDFLRTGARYQFSHSPGILAIGSAAFAEVISYQRCRRDQYYSGFVSILPRCPPVVKEPNIMEYEISCALDLG
jgi:hypothetical protein